MFATNYSSPLVVSSGTLHDVLIAWRTAFLALSDNPWAEVTGSSPTPAFLQPYASAGVTAAATTYGTHQITFYLTTDEGLEETTPVCRMFRLLITNYSIRALFIDTATADPSVNNNWCYMTYSNNTNYSSDTGSSPSLSNFCSAYAANNTTPLGGYPFTFYMFVWDDFLFFKTEANSTDRGGLVLFYPSIPEDQCPRGNYPWIWGMTGSYNTGTNALVGAAAGVNNYSYTLCIPKYTGGEATYNMGGLAGQQGPSFVTELGNIIFTTPDNEGREYIQRIAIFRNAGNSNYTFWGGFNNHIRVVREGLTLGRLQLRIIDSVEHVEIKLFTPTGLDQAWFLRLADNNA